MLRNRNNKPEVALALVLAIMSAWTSRRSVYAAAGTPPPQAASPTAAPNAALGLSVYQSHCMVCHRDTRAGLPPVFPSLINVSQRLTDQQIITMIHSGKGNMPSFPNLQDPELEALLLYLRTGVAASSPSPAPTSQPLPAHASGDPAGAGLYEKNCAICHGEKLEGIVPGFPALQGVATRLTSTQIADLIRSGKGRMPGFDSTKLSEDQMQTLLRFLNSQTM